MNGVTAVHSRRRFLAGLAATGAAALLPDGRFGAQAQAPARAAHRIDVHCHFSSPGFIQTIKARNTGQMPLMAWTPARTIEDMDRGERNEAALFHLLNLAREKKASLLITGETPPDRWGLRTPDLLSRLRLAPSVSLEAPDDALLKAVLVKLFVDRQLVVDTSVVDYIALRIERSLAKASELVALLDREALSRGRRVSRAIAAEILGAAQETDESE